MMKLSIVCSPALQEISGIHELDELHFVSVDQHGPDMRAILNRAPVKQLNPFPLEGNPRYLQNSAQ